MASFPFYLLAGLKTISKNAWLDKIEFGFSEWLKLFSFLFLSLWLKIFKFSWQTECEITRDEVMLSSFCVTDCFISSISQHVSAMGFCIWSCLVCGVGKSFSYQFYMQSAIRLGFHFITVLFQRSLSNAKRSTNMPDDFCWITLVL